MDKMDNNEPKSIGRILMIAPTPFFADRGCHVRILGEAKALITLGYKIVVCTYGIGRDVEGIPTERIARIPWYNKLSAGPSVHKLYIDLLLLWKVIRICQRFKPNLIHAHLHEGIVIGKIASAIFAIPLVADLQGSLTAELLDHKFLPNTKWLISFMYWIEKKINQMPSHLIVSCSPTAQRCIEFFGISANRVSSIMDGVDLDIFSPQAKDPVLQAALGIVTEGK
jgi:glycosyltransferase involved in cell wall biosynthesis